jgi:Bacterial DNA-binding protein
MADRNPGERFVARASDGIKIDFSQAKGPFLFAESAKLSDRKIRAARLAVKPRSSIGDAALIKKVVSENCIDEATAKVAIEAVFAAISEALADGKDVKVRNFGTFSSHANPGAGSCKAGHDTLEFHAAKELVNALR